MKTVICLLIIALTVATGVAKEPSQRGSRDGTTKDRAIIMTGSREALGAKKLDAFRRRYPDANFLSGSMWFEDYHGRHLDCMTLPTSHGKRTMYFDITDVK